MKITKLFSFLFALSLLSPQVLIANDIEWSFDSDAQGWHDMGDDRDVVAGKWEVDNDIYKTFFRNGISALVSGS